MINLLYAALVVLTLLSLVANMAIPHEDRIIPVGRTTLGGALNTIIGIESIILLIFSLIRML